MTITLDDRLDALASTQLGILTRDDVLSAGGTDHYIETCLLRRR